MKKAWAAVIFFFALAAALGALAQDTSEGGAAAEAEYDRLQIDAGLLTGGFDSTIESLSGGARIVLFSSKDPKQRLPISANEIRFVWPSGGECESMVLTGRVVVDHPEVHVESEKAEWDMEKGLLVFTGDPVIKKPGGQEARGQRIVVNMADRTFEVHGVVVPTWDLNGAGFGGVAAAKDPSLLTEKDVLDWPGLLTKVKAEAAEPPSPGKQVVSQLDQSAQKMIMSVPVQTLAENKEALVKQINRVLESPKFYDEAAWQGINIGQQTRDLLEKQNPAPKDITQANRALLEAAYPGMIAQRAQSAD